MEKFTTLTGVAAPLPMVNVDTDAIIPKQYLKTIKRTGLSAGLFHEMRTDRNGVVTGEFVLDKPAYRDAKILVAGDNFGCGSSREHAPWALLDAGIRCVISTSFADIFFNNCFKNGILPVVLPQADVDALMADAQMGANATVTVDLEPFRPDALGRALCKITRPNGETVAFEVEPFRKHCLLNGLDDIGLRRSHGFLVQQKAASIRQLRPTCPPRPGLSPLDGDERWPPPAAALDRTEHFRQTRFRFSGAGCMSNFHRLY